MPRKTCRLSSSFGLGITGAHSHKIFSRTAKEKSAQFKLLETCVFHTLTPLIIKITISSIVIGFKNSYFPLIHLPSAARSSDFVITRMITDRIGLHSVLLPLLIIWLVPRAGKMK